MTFLLILLFSFNGGNGRASVTAAEYRTQDACEKAAKWATLKDRALSHLCIPLEDADRVRR